MTDELSVTTAGDSGAVLGGEPSSAPADTTTTTEKPAAKAAETTPAPVDAKKADAKADAPAEDDKAPADDKPVKETKEVKAAKAEAASWPEDGLPEDWRERILKTAGVEGDALKRLQEVAKRATSPAELLRSVAAGTTKITELTAELKGRVKIPGAKADAEEVSAFQKAWGVPETADKYDLKPLGELNEIDAEVWGEVLPTLHKGNVSQDQLNVIAKALETSKTVVERRMEERAKAIDAATKEALLLEHGSSKAVKANVELANRYMGELLGGHMDFEARKEFMNLRLEDGTRIGSHLPFTKAIIEAARQWAPDGLPEIGENGVSVDIDARVREITSMAHSSDPAKKKEYERLQPELDRLIAAQNRRAGKGK